MTYNEFAIQNDIRCSIHPVNSRPDGFWSDQPGFHYKVRIGRGRRSFGLYFSTGTGWTKQPGLDDVLDCLASDASGYENAQSFEDWANEYGYDADSRKAEKTYRTIKRQAEQLKRTIGDEAYNTLLWDTERL